MPTIKDIESRAITRIEPRQGSRIRRMFTYVILVFWRCHDEQEKLDKYH